MNSIKKLLPCALLLLFSGCAVDSSEVDSGLFVDAPVEGLMYQSGSIVGRTDSEGRFYYEGTAPLTFSIDGLIIGESTPKEHIFPFDLFTSNLFVSDPKVSNMSRFLQSLDSDGNPDNGIVISETTRSSVTSIFGTSTTIDFSGNAFEAITSFTTLRSATAAQTHLLASIASYGELKVDMINLGDGFTAGIQSAEIPFQNSSTHYINLHKFTQPQGFASLMAGRLSSLLGSNFTWTSPLLNIDQNRLKTLSTNAIHYNLAVPGATAKSLTTETTGGGNEMLDLLLSPIFNNLSAAATTCASSGSQVDAALCLATQTGHEQRLKLFTLWIGNNDVLGAITEGKASNLTFTNISTFLSSADHSYATVSANISSALTQLASINDIYIFIATLPDVTRTGALFFKEDIDYLARFAAADVTALKNYTAASGTDVVALGFSGFTSIAPLLAGFSNISSLDAAISALPDDLKLTKDEAALFTDRVDQLNTFINTFANPVTYPKVFVVDIHKLYEDLAAGKIETATGTLLDAGFGGGFFSMDGIYPSNTGYALIAREFLEKIRSPYTIDNPAHVSYADYTSFVLSEGINTDDGIGIKIDPATIDLAGIRESDAYRDNDGDGFADGPGQILFGLTSIPSMDPSLLFMGDCNDADINTLPQVISGIACY